MKAVRASKTKYESTGQTNLEFILKSKSSLETSINFITKKSNVAETIEFIKSSGEGSKTNSSLDYILKSKPSIQKSLDVIQRKPTTEEVINKSQNILFDGNLTDKQKEATWYEYLKTNLVDLGYYSSQTAASWLVSSAKMFAFLAAFYALGSVAAAAATAGSFGQFLSMLTALGYGSVTISGPLLGLLTKGLGSSLVSGVGVNLTISGALKLARKAGANEFLNKKLDDGYAKSFLIKLGVDPNMANREAAVRELANAFLIAAPSALAMAGGLPTGLMFLAGDPVTTLGLGYGIRMGGTALSKISRPRVAIGVDLRSAVSSVVQNTRKIKERVVGEMLSASLVDINKSPLERAEIAVETKEKVDQIIREELPLKQTLDVEIETQKAVLENVELEVPTALQNPESVYSIGVSTGLTLAAMALAFSTGNVPNFQVFSTLGGTALAAAAETTLSATTSLAQSQMAQMFLLNAVSGKVASKLTSKVFGGKSQEELNAAREKAKRLYTNYKSAVAKQDMENAHTYASKFWNLMTGKTIYTTEQLDKMGLNVLKEKARKLGLKTSVNHTASEYKAMIVNEQIRRLNEINGAVSSTVASVASLAMSHMLVKGYQGFQSGEINELLNNPNVPYSEQPVLDLSETGFVLGEGETAAALKTRMEGAKMAQKELQRETRRIEQARAELQRQAELQASKIKFEQALASRLAQGKAVGGVTTLGSGETLTGFSFSTSELLSQIDKDLGNTEFTTLADMFAGTLGWKAASSVLDFVPGMGYLKAATKVVHTAQYAQQSVNILEKVGQLATEGGLEKVAKSGFEATYASTFEGVQQLTAENAAKFAEANLGEAGKAFKAAIDGSAYAKTNAAIAIKSIIIDMFKNNEELTPYNLYTRIGKMLVVGDTAQQATLSGAATEMGRQLYESVMGR